MDVNGTHEITIALLDREEGSEEYKVNVTFYKQGDVNIEVPKVEKLKPIESE